MTVPLRAFKPLSGEEKSLSRGCSHQLAPDLLLSQRQDTDFGLILPPDTHVANGLPEPMLERAIGVIYRPASELPSHYFQASLSNQFDAILHFDQKTVERLEPTAERGGV